MAKAKPNGVTTTRSVSDYLALYGNDDTAVEIVGAMIITYAVCYSHNEKSVSNKRKEE
ncbi:hypothetical protein [Candidatus Doolittlea endobia]|uniref:Uncharacterized protein n=1 Tax=Candidatus Doolittlea endobia TaxID=1778262 RepID=A0A143WS02_9ENTR|nr:hypothetical protein [Candidatus Doolittlea endobia]CUX96596.1 hypothetical protein MHIR_DE00291 [Candidatus Doolittlea endobia]